MKIVCCGSEDQLNEFISDQNDSIIRVNDFENAKKIEDADAFIFLNKTENKDLNFSNQPIFLNEVVEPISNQSSNIFRFNGWNGFMHNKSIEVAGKNFEQARNIFSEIGKEIIESPDIPGLISARVIALIINEAFMTFDEKIANQEDIDQAMKLGTNYPFGPFEWTNKIGIDNIISLLKKMAESDSRYQPSEAILKYANQ